MLRVVVLGALVALTGRSGAVTAATAGSVQAPATPAPSPEAESLELDQIEFGILHEAAARSRDTLSLDVHMSNGTGGTVWSVGLSDPRVGPALDRALADLGSAVLASIEGRSPLTAETRIRIQTIATLRARIRQAGVGIGAGSDVEFAGVLEHSDSTWTLRTTDGPVRLEPRLPGSPAEWIGHEVVVKGQPAEERGFEVHHLFVRHRNTIDLFVMSLCPYGQEVETELIQELREAAGGVLPALRIHYILYSRPADGGRLTSLHGDAELREDVVQMLLRDRYPDVYWSYLLLRARSADPWESLAARAGLAPADIQRVRRGIRADGDAVAHREYEDVALGCGVSDGSPTLAWEGLTAASVQIPEGSRVGATAGACARAH